MRYAGFNLFRLLGFIKEEILIVLGTSSSEAALPSLIAKLKKGGCSESVVGLVVPTGYSFNLDGTSIYLTMAAIFLAQATNTHLIGNSVATMQNGKMRLIQMLRKKRWAKEASLTQPGLSG